jgi:hypothetical protein
MRGFGVPATPALPGVRSFVRNLVALKPDDRDTINRNVFQELAAKSKLIFSQQARRFRRGK